ncbi:MAG: 3-phosphoshikimate 1-carboxyvinyltransferase [Gemmatimonas sp.]|nr:3-phosphoshikimate 1-carboxyvinyltransferase [Gemmatimonas sp.]
MPLHIDGDFTVPGDKSLTHRALMLAAAARGESRLRGLLPGEDCRRTAEILGALGVEVPELPLSGAEIVLSSDGIDAWSAPADVLDCGNSGTTARLMMGLLAGRPFCATLTGDASLRSRPMRRITEPLALMGVRSTELEEPDRLPLEICGGELRGIDYRSPKSSAQIKSAVLLAGVSGRVAVSVHEPVRSRDHSERMLRSLGIEITEGPRDGGWLVAMSPSDGELPPLDMEVPGDPSSAAFLIALGSLAESGEMRIRGIGLNPTRTGFFGALRRMGGQLRTEGVRASGGESIGDLIVQPAELHGISVGGPEVPSMIDEIPVLACLAARASGETRVTGADELRAKESDRISTIVRNLRALGADAGELPDGLIVRGSDRPLRGLVRAHHDHRIAMAFGVLAALPENEITIDTPEIVEVSFPGFWETLGHASGSGTGIG